MFLRHAPLSHPLANSTGQGRRRRPGCKTSSLARVCVTQRGQGSTLLYPNTRARVPATACTQHAHPSALDSGPGATTVGRCAATVPFRIVVAFMSVDKGRIHDVVLLGQRHWRANGACEQALRRRAARPTQPNLTVIFIVCSQCLACKRRGASLGNPWQLVSKHDPRNALAARTRAPKRSWRQRGGRWPC